MRAYMTSQELATLADRLIHDQVRCAQQDEQIMALRKDLSRSRTECTEVNARLDDVTELYENLKQVDYRSLLYNIYICVDLTFM